MLCDVLFRITVASMTVCVGHCKTLKPMPPVKASNMSVFLGPTQPAVRPKPLTAIEESDGSRRLWGSGQS